MINKGADQTTRMRKLVCVFVLLVEDLRPSQHIFSYVGTGHPGLNRTSTKDK